MDARTRQKLNHVSSGTTTVLSDGTVNRYTYVETDVSVNDYWHKHRDPVSHRLPSSDFERDRIERVPPTLSGENGFWRHNGAPMISDYVPPLLHYPARAARQFENDYYALQLAAKTHPFRADFSVPTMIFEFLDIGTLFKITAKGFFDLVGSSYLNYRFGFPQFVRDIQTLSKITVAIERRIREFDSLIQKSGLHRQVGLDSNHWDLNGNQGFIWTTYGVYVIATFQSSETLKVEGSIRWKLKPGVVASLDKLSAFNLAVKTVFDLGELDASTIWNSIPWTWLADYFVDVGTWLQANENNDIVECSDICILRHYKHNVDIVPGFLSNGDAAAYRGNKGRFSRDIIARDIVPTLPVLPPVRFSLLSKTQILTLLALYGKFRGGTY